jgi:hypothetical protein
MSVVLWLPRDIEYFAAMDWGHANPGCFGWWACLPTERYHVVAEWKFQWLADEEIAEGYHEHTKALGVKTVRYIAGDPSMWIRDGRNAARGQSRAETFVRAKMPLRKAENDRVAGWSRLHSMLRIPRDRNGVPTGEPPILTIDETCEYLKRTVPALRSDKTDAEDVDTTGDDHGGDMLRYGGMSRPRPSAAHLLPPPPVGTWGHVARELVAGAKRAVIGSENVRSARG